MEKDTALVFFLGFIALILLTLTTITVIDPRTVTQELEKQTEILEKINDKVKILTLR